MTNNRNNQSNQVAANHISDYKNTGSNRNSLIKTKWRKTIALMLSLGVMASVSSICLADEQLKQEAEHTGIRMEMRMMTKEEIAADKRKFLYNFLNHLTKSYLAVSDSWDGSFDLSLEEEKTIKEADAFYSNEENQKLLHGSSNFPTLSAKEEEVLKKSLKYLTAFSEITGKPNQIDN